MKTMSILISGVGGQGTLLASMILGHIAINKGYDVKLSEVHGMAQRGGSVITHARFGEKVYSPIVDRGGADILISFEKLETLRWIPYLKKDGIVLSNTQEILPMPVITGAQKYPSNIEEIIKNKFKKSIFVDALSIAREVGNTKAVNSVMLGLLAKNMHIDKSAWINAIKDTVKPKFIDMNIEALERGYSL